MEQTIYKQSRSDTSHTDFSTHDGCTRRSCSIRPEYTTCSLSTQISTYPCKILPGPLFRPYSPAYTQLCRKFTRMPCTLRRTSTSRGTSSRSQEHRGRRLPPAPMLLIMHCIGSCSRTMFQILQVPGSLHSLRASPVMLRHVPRWNPSSIDLISRRSGPR
jgi:hypothetical protein